MLATVDDAGTPQPVLDRLNRELTQIVKSPALRVGSSRSDSKRARRRATNSADL
jgi:hypothetical protein